MNIVAKKNSFVKNFTIIGGSTFLNLVIGVLTTPIITRIVQPEDYGQLSMFTLYTGMAVSVFCLGLDQSLIRFYYEQNDMQYKGSLLKIAMGYPLLISVILSAAVCILAFFKGSVLGYSFFFAVLLCCNIIIQLVYRFSLLVVRLEQNSNLYATLQVANKLLYVIFALVLLVLTDMDDFVSLAAATLLAGLVCMIMSIHRQKDHWLTKYNHTESLVPVKELLKYGYPFIFSMGITLLFQAADKLALNKYCSYGDIGIYASAMSLVNIFAIVQTTFNTLWAPIALEHYAKDPDDTLFYTKVNRIITVLMFFLGSSLILCKDLFAVLLGEEYREAAFVLPFLIFNPIMYTISETTNLGIVFRKKSHMQIFIVLLPCVINIVGNTILVPHMGARGAAISTGISYIIFYTMRTLISRHYYPVDYSMKSCYLATAVVSVYAFYNTTHRIDWISVLGYVACVGVVMLLYRDAVKLCVDYGKQFLLDLKVKGYAKLHRNEHG